MYSSLLSIACGAVLGAWLRWFVGLKFNSTFQNFPLGTILVNLVGGFIIGFAIALFANMQLSSNYKLFVITGFCGALTTFSTFSAEVIDLLQQQKYGFAIALITIHLMGSLLCTVLGLLSYQWLSQH
ncbi:MULTISPECIES: fluoride efflux transporter CrcB [Acinetobacter]|uniref:Fluoride-specific ion channel FluC n=2 Tax=Acinetobacter baylyi TaxID=202950 RepID=FLUC_ACIAD|nr:MULTISPECIES: fluoride efflux transporter CrcB [Acinetobacter]Q6FF10.1 RecName: Full=Fluoride-specific ion channel FluC [Acinetobacter baylyi ADP1]ENV52786.1 protein CrcB [Acinetobacter baylyi DSM 14961 = CIP 107474]KAF2369911.1 fluoride ion transporter CrcB [Acinetobacter baylyi]KAF2375765.1 fluoride ion transporter CrcB [Acinetobacter baylyi]KAF2377324.1 fluoride ion transporter CrcB [Acinetobacter baylyi]KAF2383371.1 fluoride ion transporter CrcB [Acinetobacter baylyi]